MKEMNIAFSPPDISEEEITAVSEVLRSGWITTGPKTKQFEKEIASYCHTSNAVCLNSQTACSEMTLKILGIQAGDEIILPAYTYTATASVVEHVGATIVMIDSQKDNYEMDYNLLESKISERTKVIIPVDIGGVLCDYDRIYEIVERKRNLFKASNNDIQKAVNRIIVLSDSAHSFGASRNEKMSGSFSDFSCFSFHAVKNLTTAEGGAVTWKDIEGINNNEIYRQYQLLSLHGQSKDALAKNQIGAWEYDIEGTYYKCNMTDIMAAIGLVQFKRYPKMIERRKQIINRYNDAFKECKLNILNHRDSSGHLYMIRINTTSVKHRDELIVRLAKKGIAVNVHYKPLPMHTAYKKLGFKIENYPNAYQLYVNEITLPLNTSLSDEDVDYIIEVMKTEMEEILYVC